MFAFVVLDLVSSVLGREIGCIKCLQNHLYFVLTGCKILGSLSKIGVYHWQMLNFAASCQDQWCGQLVQRCYAVVKSQTHPSDEKSNTQPVALPRHPHQRRVLLRNLTVSG